MRCRRTGTLARLFSQSGRARVPVLLRRGLTEQTECGFDEHLTDTRLQVRVCDFVAPSHVGSAVGNIDRFDDQLDKVELLREITVCGDHGVHAVLPTPDGNALFLVCGNGAKPTTLAPTSPVPAIWGEDHLLPRMPDDRGFMKDVMGPGGIIYRDSPEFQSFLDKQICHEA